MLESVPEILKLAGSRIGPFPLAFAFNEALGKAASPSVSLSLNSSEGFSAEVVGFSSCGRGPCLSCRSCKQDEFCFESEQRLKEKIASPIKDSLGNDSLLGFFDMR